MQVDAYISDELVAQSFTNSRLEIFILPTEQCNFRCTYCYEDFRVGRIKSHVVAGIKKLIESRAEKLLHLRIQWFGGEPLLALNVIRNISNHVKLIQNSFKELRHEGIITTNGYLLDVKTLTELISLNNRTFQISLDGPPECHNTTRVTIGGQATFNKIWENLIAALKTDQLFKVILRIHLTPENLSFMHDFALKIRHYFLHDERYVAKLIPIAHLGGSKDSNFDVLSKSKAAKAIAEIGKILAQPELPNNEQKVCYAAKPNSFVIRANGRIAKCTVALSDSRNEIGIISKNGLLNIDNDKLKLWLRGWSSMSNEELFCPLEKLSKK